tara:strand:- start:900 stop:1454 length:555 start_codon:yes stop_codon:yes gene_type:complete
MFKNVAGQSYRVFAFDRETNQPVTGIALTITAKLAKDYGTPTATATSNPTEVEDGYYLFPLTQAETHCDDLAIYPESSQGKVVVLGCPANVHPILDTDRGFLVNICVRYADNSVVPYCEIVITTTNTNDTTDVYRKGTCNELGQIDLTLPQGTYYLWRQKLNATFNDPATLTVASDGSTTITES